MKSDDCKLADHEEGRGGSLCPRSLAQLTDIPFFFSMDCVEIKQCVGCARQFFTKSFLGDDPAVLARSSGEEPALPRHRAGVASMAGRSARRFSTNAP